VSLLDRMKLNISIKKWKCPEGIFVTNFVGHEAIINTMSVNEEGVMFSGADNGSLTLWDYNSGLPFQHLKDIPQPGSLDAEAVSTAALLVLTTGCVLLSVRQDGNKAHHGWSGQDDQGVFRTSIVACIHPVYMYNLDGQLSLLDIGQILLVRLQSGVDPVGNKLVDLFGRPSDKRSGVQ
jgi:WD40 repeat protein